MQQIQYMQSVPLTVVHTRSASDPFVCICMVCVRMYNTGAYMSFCRRYLFMQV